MKTIIFTLLAIIFFGCVKATKPLNPKSKRELNTIISELKLENVDYGYVSKTTNGVKSDYFKISMKDIDDSTDFVPYTKRLIQLFNNSGYELDKCDFIVFYFYKAHLQAKLFKFYRINPRNYTIIEETDR